MFQDANNNMIGNTNAVSSTTYNATATVTEHRRH